jgi:RHS repeat-associated protein
MTTGGASYFYHYDPLGSVISVTNSSGATQWTESYEPFGAIRTETKNSNKAPTNLMKFAGEYLDPTGLYHLRARQYDVTTGRFLSPDPLQPVTGSPYTGAYSYISNRPTFATDPTGRCFAICGIVGAVVNTAVYAVETAVTDESFSWSGAAQAAGEGFVIGATGGLGATVGREVLGGVVRATTAKVIGSTVAGAVGGYAVTQAQSLARGCGFASGGESVRGALVGAASAGGGERFFGQVGFQVRTLRGIFRNQPNTRRMWGGAIAGSAADAKFGPTTSCDVGADGK